MLKFIKETDDQNQIYVINLALSSSATYAHTEDLDCLLLRYGGRVTL